MNAALAPALTLTLASSQVVAVTLSDAAQQQFLAELASRHATATATAEVLTRTYHLGGAPTPGRGYDDRLTSRTGCGQTKLRQALGLAEKRGGLRHKLNGARYVVTEIAVREWLGDGLRD